MLVLERPDWLFCNVSVQSTCCSGKTLRRRVWQRNRKLGEGLNSQGRTKEESWGGGALWCGKVRIHSVNLLTFTHPCEISKLRQSDGEKMTRWGTVGNLLKCDGLQRAAEIWEIEGETVQIKRCIMLLSGLLMHSLYYLTNWCKPAYFSFFRHPSQWSLQCIPPVVCEWKTDWILGEGKLCKIQNQTKSGGKSGLRGSNFS